MLRKVKKLARSLSLKASYGCDPVLDIKSLHRARKRIIRVAIVIALILAVFQRSRWPVDSVVYQGLTRFGILLLAIAVAGRAWAWSHLGRRKRWNFICDGPYSIARHPLYAFSILATIGIAAQSGSIIMVLLLLVPVWAVFNRVARIEEMDMASRFGEPYLAYLACTPRFFPRKTLWTAPEGIWVEYSVLIKCLRDAKGFALAVPVFIALDWMQRMEIVPVLLRLP